MVDSVVFMFHIWLHADKMKSKDKYTDAQL